MLVWSRSGRFVVWLVAALLIGVIFLAPLAVIIAASLAEQWNGVLPTGFTFEHYRDAGSGASGDAVLASLITGFVASLLALLSGSWAALALRAQGEAWSRTLGLLFFIPSAVPSVSVGLGLLVAFSQQPLLLNGTTAIVIPAAFWFSPPVSSSPRTSSWLVYGRARSSRKINSRFTSPRFAKRSGPIDER